MVHAADDLLADIAALLEIDAAEHIHQSLVWESLAKGEILASRGDTQRDAMGVIGCKRGGILDKPGRPQGTCAQGRLSWIGEDDRAGRFDASRWQAGMDAPAL